MHALCVFLSRPALTKVAAGVVLGAASVGAWALPVFTLDPAGASTPLAGEPVTADNIVVSDFSTVRLTGTAFTDTGFLSVQSFQLGGTTVTDAGLNTTFGLFFAFNGTGSQLGGNPFSNPTSGSFDTLTYTLYGYNGGPATFGFDGSDNPTVSVAPGSLVTLATGSLVPGANQSSVGSLPQSPSFTSFAGANLTFNPGSQAGSFFLDPTTFYNLAVSSFINSPTQVSPVAGGFANGFKISQGGGSVNFAAPIPEPETWALMLVGLGATGWLTRRRRT